MLSHALWIAYKAHENLSAEAQIRNVKADGAPFEHEKSGATRTGKQINVALGQALEHSAEVPHIKSEDLWMSATLLGATAYILYLNEGISDLNEQG